MSRWTDLMLDGVPVVELESRWLRVRVAPSIGGRIVGLEHRPTGQECLWRNRGIPLRRVAPGTVYDPEFYGGIDEQIPCDPAEEVAGVEYPDHGELWTQELEGRHEDDELVLRGELPLLGFSYERRLFLEEDAPTLRARYRLTNRSGQPRAFLWKLHVALAVAPGDRILCPAAQARPLDLAWSRCEKDKPFPWPVCGDLDMSRVPEADGTAEFLALTGLAEGRIGWTRVATGLSLSIAFDRAVFPCCQFFATYGKLLGHYTAILEPSTTPCVSLAEAVTAGTCRWLAAGETLETEVTYRVETPTDRSTP